jgi:glycine/D-amino acid oxidase-like deaminating enzyme/nitrite reductase/ring-hydroxylating ferredoxin subunit
MKKESYWLATGDKGPRKKTLSKDLETEVLVIGGGITGMTAALLLRQAGKKVILVERDKVGSGDSGYTTAHLTYMTDTRLSDLVSTFGEAHALASWDAGAAAMEQIQTLASVIATDCHLRTVPGFLVAHKDAKDVAKETEELEKEAHLASNHGFDVTHGPAVPPTGRPAIRFANQLKFHPIKYLHGLAALAVEEGVDIYEETNVEEFLEKPARVKAGGHTITYEKVVIATHMPLQGLSGTLPALLLQTKLYAYTTYAIQAVAPAGSCPEMIWSDTAEPFNYLRTAEGKEILIYGGQDHRTGQSDQPEACYDRLVKDLSELVPGSTAERRWSGQVIETPDGLPYIGWVAEGQFMATGYSGNGYTFGTLAGMMARDAITGRKNPWADLFDPGRKKLSAVWDYLKENADYPYYLAKDRAAQAEGDSVREVPCDEGKIIKLQGKKVAVHRDAAGEVTKLSPVCPHLGCIVHWNSADKTWDCPCHGSRFQANGKLFAGPAEKGLSPAR